MDENKGGNGGAVDPREELREQLQMMGKAAGELLEQLVKVPATLAQIPLQQMPDGAADHARNAAREGFEAVRTLLDAMAKGIEQIIKDTSSAVGTSTGASSTESSESGEYGNTRRMDGDNSNGYGEGQNTTRLDND